MYLYLRPFVRLFVSLSDRLYPFLVIIRAACNCVQRMWTQATGSNPLSGSIICLSVRPSGHLREFFDFLFVFISSVGVGGTEFRCIFF